VLPVGEKVVTAASAMSGFNLSALAVRERAVTLFLVIAIAGAGAYAFTKLGRAEDPTFTVKVLTVTALEKMHAKSDDLLAGLKPVRDLGGPLHQAASP
jgi:hypothetical protein